MTVVETLLVFAGIPVLALGILALLSLVPGAVRSSSRYRPGKPWQHPAVWFVPQPERVADQHDRPAPPHAELGAGPGHHELEAATPAGGTVSTTTPAAPVKTAKGGAHGSW